MGRAPCCAKEGLRKGPWSAKEDLLLTNYINEHGEGQWRSLPNKAGLLRCGKSCRLRWMNYLKPGIKRGNLSQDEEDLILRLHSLLGNRWSLIAGRLPGRTDNEIKNYWNTHLIKKLKSAGIEPKVNKSFSKYCSKKQTTTDKPRKKQVKKKKNKKIKDQALVQDTSEPPQVVFVPKPIRISSGHSRNYSVDQNVALSSSSSNNNNNNIINNDENEGKVAEVSFDPLFDEVVLDGCCELSAEWSLPTDDSMLEKVYEEYLQLISEKCFLQFDDPLAENVSDHPMLM